MKRYKLITFLFCISPFIFLSQNLYPVKEHYDKIYSNFVPNSINYLDKNTTGNSLSWTLSGLIRMYETTGDKAYLVKFINIVINIQKARQDELHLGDSTYPPKWTLTSDINCGNIECTYYNSLLLYPMAEFVNIVVNDQALYNTYLPIQPFISQDLIEMNHLEQMQPYFQIIGYGDFARWLGFRVEQTILYMNAHYWDDNFGIKKKQGDMIPADMNMQAPYASAVLLMALAEQSPLIYPSGFGFGNQDQYFLYQAQINATHIKGNIDIEDRCNGSSYHAPLLRYLNSNNSYWWYHRGWRIEEHWCLLYGYEPELNSYQQSFEDVSHGAMSISYILAAYNSQLSPCNNCPPYFTNVELERFKNTFTKNIYFTNNTGGHFHNTVYGVDYGFTENECSPTCPPDEYYGEALNWMPLYQFDDNSSLQTYDILLNYTIGLIQNNATQYLTGAQSYLGLSEVVKAQWDKECINLTLYSRDVVYDQDFLVKNKLIVSPQLSDNFYQAGVDDPFAEPKTFSDNGIKDRFVVEQGTTVNFVVGESATFKPGTHLKAGSIVHAYIDPNYCTDGMKGLNTSKEKMVILKNYSTENDVLITGNDKKRDSLNHSHNERSFKLYPNPTEDKFIIESDEKIVEIIILNQLGYEIEKMDVSINEFSMQDYSSGIYWIKIIFENNEEKVVKLVKI